MSNEVAEIDGRYFEIIGGGSAVMQFVVFTAVGEFALESLVYGAVAGLFGGVGAYLFLPWFLRLSAIQEESPDDLPFSDIVRQAEGNPQLSVFGAGLEAGAVVMLAVGFALDEPNFLYGPGAALGFALVVAIVGSVLFDR